jgi:hypothetical protein
MDETVARNRIDRTATGGRAGFNSCVTAFLAAVAAVALVMILGLVVADRIAARFEFNPFGIFAEPETTIDDRRAAVVLEMQTLSRLETSVFTIEHVIEAERAGNVFQNLLFGDRILLIAHGQVIAGVDLSRLSEPDVEITDDNAVRLTLPPSEIFIATLDNEQTRVYDRDRGLLSRGSTQLETEARQAAEASILQAACDQGILERAAADAKTQITALLRLLEFEDVEVIAPAGQCP